MYYILMDETKFAKTVVIYVCMDREKKVRYRRPS